MTQPPLIRVAHSPDSDDAFMFYGLAHHLVDTEGLTFEHHLCDIETLNQDAFEGKYEMTAISYHAYAHLRDKYALLTVGSSVGDKYGPVVITSKPMTRDDLSGQVVAIPGQLTTAHLILKIWNPDVKTAVVPFDQIMDRVKSGEFVAGVIIHEGQLTFAQEGFVKVADLGEWWFQDCNLTLPLGANAIRKDLGPDLIQKIARVFKRSVQYSLAHREQALDYAMTFARGLERAQADTFVGMYVNEMTLNVDVELRKAVKLLLWRGQAVGLLADKVEPEFIDVLEPVAS